MRPQRVNLALWSTTALAAAIAPCALYAGLFAPLDASATAKTDVATPRGRPIGAATQAVPTIESFGPVLARAFRPPLDRAAAEAPGKAAVAEPPVAAAPAALRLVGSVGDSVAMIQGPDGTVALVEVGDDVDGADVVAIGPTRVDLRQNGRHVVLERQPVPDASGVTIR